MDEVRQKQLLIELYEQIRHNHERAVALTNSTLALVAAMKKDNPEFEAKYGAAFQAEVSSSRAEADGLVLGVIDGILRELREG